MKIEFFNKIAVKGTGKIKTVHKILRVCAIILLLISLFQLWIGGAGEVSWFTNVLVPIGVLVYFRLNYNADGYANVRCDLNIENDGFHVCYYDVNYNDGNGVHEEHIHIPYQRIQEIQYSKVLDVFEISSKPIVTLIKDGKKEVSDYNTIGKTHICALHPPVEDLDKIVNYIQKNNFVPMYCMDK